MDVTTIDAFALSLLTRLHEAVGSALPDFETGDFAGTHNAVIAALRRPSVRSMCAVTFPLVVIDEFQDCSGTKLELVKALGACVPLVIAADEFQVLQDENEGRGLDWCKQCLRHIDLGSRSQRTADLPILATAKALRTGQRTESPVRIAFAPSPDVAAGVIRHACKGWKGSTAVLAYKCDRSHFVEATFHALTKARPSDSKIQPMPASWDPSAKSATSAAIRNLMNVLPAQLPVCIARPQQLPHDYDRCWQRCVRHARRKGMESVARASVMAEIRRELHWRRAFGARSMRRVFTTIHSAKNQEWNNVVVLWSRTHFRVDTPEDLKRRLLYNAVTRAKQTCVIVVDGAEYNWASDPILSLLGQPTTAAVEASRPKAAKKR